jgi:hypothetical protein
VSLGKLIQIDKDFTYKRIGTVIGEEVEIPNMENGFRKIGYNTSENKRTFNFDEKNKPILIVEPKQNISELENVPAIRRVAGTTENSGDK